MRQRFQKQIGKYHADVIVDIDAGNVEMSVELSNGQWYDDYEGVTLNPGEFEELVKLYSAAKDAVARQEVIE